NGRSAGSTRLASVEAPVPASKPRTLMDMFFGDKPEARPPATVQLAALSEPTQRTVPTIEISAPVPAPPLRALDGSVVAAAPVPAQKSSRLLLATRAALPAAGESALTALATLEV